MTSTIEYLALAAVAIVLVVSVVQATQISGLNEKVAQQNAALLSFVSSGVNAGAAAQTAAQQGPAPSQSAPSQQMVGGC